MEDSFIIELYFGRDERAISETEKKYGAFCRTIAQNILSEKEDAEECVNDAWLKAWSAIPPERPKSLKAWLGRVVRNISIDRWRCGHAKKRYSGAEIMLDELEDCIPAAEQVETQMDARELSGFLNGWLDSLKKEERVLFVRRYWYGMSLNELADERRVSSAKLAGRMFRLRKKLKDALEAEGIAL